MSGLCTDSGAHFTRSLLCFRGSYSGHIKHVQVCSQTISFKHCRVCFDSTLSYLFPGGFAFLEASQQSPGDTAILRSPQFQLTGQACFRMAYHMRGLHIGALEVEAVGTTDQGVTSTTILDIEGEQGGKG